MLSDPAYLANERIKKWKGWHDVMMSALAEKRLLPLGFSRPDDNLLPFLAELDGSSIVAGHGGGGHGGWQATEGRGRPRAEARRGAADPARAQALGVVPQGVTTPA